MARSRTELACRARRAARTSPRGLQVSPSPYVGYWGRAGRRAGRRDGRRTQAIRRRLTELVKLRRDGVMTTSDYAEYERLAELECRLLGVAADANEPQTEATATPG